MKIPKLVGHRGYMLEYPENTLFGIEAALHAGACFVEFDVQMNDRGELLVIHDANLLRTSGVDQEVFSATADQLKKISVHQPDLFLDKFKGAGIPYLKEVLELIQEYSEATALVEIKKESLKKYGSRKVLNKLVLLLEQVSARCILISFDAACLRYAREISDYPIGWVLKSYNKKSLEKAQKMSPDILICNVKKIPKNQKPADGAWQWMLYDITDPTEALKYAELGVDFIETADIGKMLMDKELKRESCNDGL